MAFRPFSFLSKLIHAGGGLGGEPGGGYAAARHAQWRAGAGDPVLSLAFDGEILAASPGGKALIGAQTDLAGRSILDFAGREDRALLKEALARTIAATGEAAAERLKFRLLRPHAGPIFAEIALVTQGNSLSALLRDRGPELAALRQSRSGGRPTSQIEGRTEGAGREAKPAGQPALNADVKSGMLADLGHELKTPLAAITQFAEAMRTEAFGPLGNDKYREYADLIHATGGHAGDLIAAMLDRAKLDAGRYELSPVLCAPAPLAQTCAEMVRGEAERAGLTLNLEIDDALPDTMLDTAAVRRIVLNLLTNAVKFTADGAVTLRVDEHDGFVEFAVIDTGVGMSQTALARLGERFTELHKNGVRGTTGTGLGLSMAHELARLHGGALQLSSAPGEGTVARFMVPVCQSLKDMAGAHVAAPADIQSQLDRVAQYRRERLGRDAA